MNRNLMIAVVVGCGGLAALVLTTPAFAQAQDSQAAGKAIGETIRGIAGPIVWSLGGFTALGAYFRRDVGLAFTTLVITLIVGGFIVGYQGIENFSESLWKKVFPPS